MKWGGPVILGSVVTLGVTTGLLNPFGGGDSDKTVRRDDSIIQAGTGGGMQSPNLPVATLPPTFTTNADGTVSTNYPTVDLPPGPIDGSIPEGYYTTRSGTAALCFDGTGYSPVGDTYIPKTAYKINGQYLNGDTTPYVVVNRADYGNIPLGSKVYVYNHNTGRGTWAIAGDRGPANHGRAEMSVATANAIGATIPRDANGNYMNAIAAHKITFHVY